MKERLPDFKPAFQSLGACVKCYDTEWKACRNNNDSERMVYQGEITSKGLNFTPELIGGRVEECIIFKKK